MKRELLVELKTVFGKDLIYPKCKDSKLICQLLYVETLNDYQIRKLMYLIKNMTLKLLEWVNIKH